MVGKVIHIATAIAVTAGSLAVVALPSVASAEVYTKREYLNRDVCYRAKKVPATVAYNTRGIKLRDASREWKGNMQRSGAYVVDRYNDEVFIQTREVIEDQHMTLVPVPCR
ncbi:hypothetical protein [Ensifer soli]|uniref:hypothetical protein n=1 Tax=Ciceribacter sp. sgz301302 TaxID=3342379 RepID=UPI0035B9CED8